MSHFPALKTFQWNRTVVAISHMLFATLLTQSTIIFSWLGGIQFSWHFSSFRRSFSPAFLMTFFSSCFSISNPFLFLILTTQIYLTVPCNIYHLRKSGIFGISYKIGIWVLNPHWYLSIFLSLVSTKCLEIGIYQWIQRCTLELITTLEWIFLSSVSLTIFINLYFAVGSTIPRWPIEKLKNPTWEIHFFVIGHIL